MNALPVSAFDGRGGSLSSGGEGGDGGEGGATTGASRGRSTLLEGASGRALLGAIGAAFPRPGVPRPTNPEARGAHPTTCVTVAPRPARNTRRLTVERMRRLCPSAPPKRR